VQPESNLISEIEAGFMSASDIATVIRQRITEGTYPPGSQLPTERAISEEFTVDRSVVRKSLMMLEKQGAVIREHGHRPRVRWDGAAVKTDRSIAFYQTITAIIPQEPHYPAATAMVQGANQALRLRESPLKIVLVDNGDAAFETRELTKVIEERPAGLIIWHTNSPETLPLLRRIEDLGIPIVFVDHYPVQLECNFVGVDNYGSAIDAVEHLLSLGHRRIAHITSTEQWTSVLERRDGYREAMHAAGITPMPEWTVIIPELKMQDLRPAVEQLMGLAEPPTAVFAMNDALAHYFVAELETAGFRVPADISVVGFDDLERYSPRPAMLTTMHQPFDKIGKRAAELLLQRIDEYANGIKAWRHVMMAAPLIVRSTSGRPNV